jgi:hypothetical protein
MVKDSAVQHGEHKGKIMKLTTKQLRSLIREECRKVFTEQREGRGNRLEISDGVVLKSDAADAYWDLENLFEKVKGGMNKSTLKTALVKFATGRLLNDIGKESAGRGGIENSVAMTAEQYNSAMNMLHVLEVLIDEDYRIYSERTGKNLGTFSSREKAEEHLDRMKRFRSKRKKKS